MFGSFLPSAWSSITNQVYPGPRSRRCLCNQVVLYSRAIITPLNAPRFRHTTWQATKFSRLWAGGRGGMYRAENTRLERTITIKIPDENQMTHTKLTYMFASTLVLVSTVSTMAQELAGARQVYDGTMRPDVEVKTFAHSEELFPVPVVERVSVSPKLPKAKTSLKNVYF